MFLIFRWLPALSWVPPTHTRYKTLSSCLFFPFPILSLFSSCFFLSKPFLMLLFPVQLNKRSVVHAVPVVSTPAEATAGYAVGASGDPFVSHLICKELSFEFCKNVVIICSQQVLWVDKPLLQLQLLPLLLLMQVDLLLFIGQYVNVILLSRFENI